MTGVKLNSKTHNSCLIQTFGDLYINNVLTDVTLITDDKHRIDAHRIVLCAGSAFLRNFLTSTANSHPFLYLKGIKGQNLQSILQFLYLGETNVSDLEIKDLLTVAKDLEITDLIIEEYPIDEDRPEHVIADQEGLSPATMKTKFKLNITQKDQVKPKYQNAGRNFKCNHCEYSALTKRSLKKHVGYLHMKMNGDKLKDFISEHQKKEETLSRVFNCTNCEFSADTKVSLGKHRDKLHRSSIENESESSRKLRVDNSEVHKEYLQTSTRTFVGNKTKIGWKSECKHCNYIAESRKPSHLQSHLKHKHPQVYHSVQFVLEQKRKTRLYFA